MMKALQEWVLEKKSSMNSQGIIDIIGGQIDIACNTMLIISPFCLIGKFLTKGITKWQCS